MNFLTNLNLNRNELQNAVIQPLAVAPSSPKAGQIYYNSGDKFIYRFDGDNWSPIGVVYIQGSTAGAVITGLDGTGKVTTTNVVGLQLAGYTPVEGGYVSNNMTMQQALAALDTAVKNAVAGGGEVNQNAWSNITVPAQSTNDSTEIVGQSAAATISATAKTDTFIIAAGDKWTHVAADKTAKKVTVGHAFSGATAGNYGDATHVAKFAIDNAGHVTNAESVEIVGAEYITTLTSDAQTQLNAKVPNTRKVNNKALDADITLDAGDVGADAAGAAAAVLGTSADDSDKATVYGARALAQKGIDAATNALGVANGKVASVNNADASIVVGGTGVDPTLKVNVSTDTDNALKLTTNGLKVVVPDGAEYSMVKLAQARDGYLASYQMTKDGTNIGEVINIPKDYLVKSAEVKTSTGTGDPSSFPAGTKYIDFTVNTYDTETGTGTESHIYLDVQSLVDVYTNGNGISISDANVISAKVKEANGLSLTANGITMAAAAASNAGAMSAAHYTKLEGIEEGATKDTITLNGSATKTPSFYAPVTAGSKDDILVSNGSGAPVWQSAPESFHKYTAQNASLSATSGAFTWSIASSTHGVKNSSMLVQLYEVATGAQVIADIVVNQTNFNITITINDVAGAGTLSANTYKVVVIG